MQALKHILYFADGEFGPTRAFRRAVALAREQGARLTLMDVTVESGISAELVQRFGLADDVQQCEQRLWALTHLAETWVRDRPARLRVTIGTPFIEVIQAVARDGHDLLIKPARERPGCRGLFDSTDMHLLRKCPCPVWIDREPEEAEPAHPAEPTDTGTEPRYARVLAAVDAAQPDSLALNRRILDTAAAVAGRDSAALEVVHAWQAPFDGRLPGAGPVDHSPRLADAIGLLEGEHAAALNEVVADDRARLNGGDTHLVRGEAASMVLDRARALAADLLVLATLSRPREPGLFIGSTAENLLQDARTSVLALKPEGFVSPVL